MEATTPVAAPAPQYVIFPQEDLVEVEPKPETMRWLRPS